MSWIVLLSIILDPNGLSSGHTANPTTRIIISVNILSSVGIVPVDQFIPIVIDEGETLINSGSVTSSVDPAKYFFCRELWKLMQ